MKDKKLNPFVTFKADRELIERLEREAKEQDRPRSWIIRQLLQRALESQKEKATA